MQVQFLKPFDKKDISQLGQKYPVKFAYARRDGDNLTVLHDPILCRDFLIDGLVWAHNKGLYFGPVYGYPYIEGVNLNETELFIEYKKTPNLSLLHELENEIGVKNTVAEGVKGGWYVNGDGWWMKTTLHISIYSYVLRCIFSGATSWEEIENREGYKSGYGGSVWDTAVNMKKHNYSSLTPSERTSPYLVHGSSGVCAYMSNRKFGGQPMFPGMP